jgi:Raf kinase inhibitor-like YbhB/YbcL family protein
MRITLVSLLCLVTPVLAQPVPTKGTIEVTSTAFKANEAIPAEYTCDGSGRSPPIAWTNVPKEAKSVALLVDDPDAPNGTFTHWLVTDLAPTEKSLPAGAALPQGAIAAKNDKGTMGYTPPCPPSGHHHYRFQVFALDMRLPKAMSRAQLLAVINGHILADGMLVGTYARTGAR